MFFSYIQDFLSNPRAALILLLLAVPPRLFAISAHEAAHAFEADRCGDPTARNLGRLTLNPLKHLDIMGIVMMLLLGIGWAKPVPVNPRNYRNGRRDDLRVSLAGIVMNLILFVLSFIAMTILLVIAGKKIGFFYYGTLPDLFGYVRYVLRDTGLPYLAEVLVTPALGKVPGYLFIMLQYFAQVNIALAIFNLIPVPPLDGYHVLADATGRAPFASAKAARICYGVLLLACFTGLLGQGIGFVSDAAFKGLGALANALLRLIRVI